MAQTMVNFRMDEDLKKGMEQACKEMGLSMTTAFTMFATKVSTAARSKRAAGRPFLPQRPGVQQDLRRHGRTPEAHFR